MESVSIAPGISASVTVQIAVRGPKSSSVMVVTKAVMSNGKLSVTVPISLPIS